MENNRVEVPRGFIESILILNSISSKDETRLYLNAVNIRPDPIKEHTMILEACDGSGLVQRRFEDEFMSNMFKLNNYSNVLLDTEDFKKLKDFINKRENKMIYTFYFFIYDDYISFSTRVDDKPYASVPIKLINREYVKTDAIIPKGNIDIEFVIDINVLNRTVDAMYGTGKMPMKKILFKFRKDNPKSTENEFIIKPIELSIQGREDIFGIAMPMKKG